MSRDSYSILGNNSYMSSILSESPSLRATTSRYSRRIQQPRFNESTLSKSEFNPNDLSMASLASTNLSNSTLLRPPSSLTMSGINPSDLTAIDEDTTSMAVPCGSTMYQQFYDGLTKYETPEYSFDLIQEFEDICNDHLNLFDSLKKKRSRKQDPSAKLEKMVKLERNTWRLIRILYEDRFRSLNADENMVVDGNPVMSDRQVIDTFYQKNGDIRQMQLVVDWLEKNSSDDLEIIEEEDKIQFYSEGPHYWENTLHSITTKRSNRELCHEMDPDASIRSSKDIHELDKEDEGRIMRYVFTYLRAGKLFVGKELAQKLGFHWLAAALEGWTLHQDDNIGSATPGGAIDGNSQRDLWKFVCWNSSTSGMTSIYERALFGALSGNVTVTLPVCPSWEDKLWAYFRASIDCQIEQQLRSTNIEKPVTSRTTDLSSFTQRASIDLPPEYWANNRTPVDIFREVEAQSSSEWTSEEKLYFHIQKSIITNDVDSLLHIVTQLIRSSEELNDIDLPQVLRFSSHVVLILRNLGLIESDVQKEFFVTIIDSYINYLIQTRCTQLIASYVSKLPQDLQVVSYSKFLRVINDKAERRKCLALAREANLNVDEITKKVVEILKEDMFSRDATDSTSVLDITLSGLISVPTEDSDRLLINALDWLSLGSIQYMECLKQGNSLMRSFMLCGKLDAAKDVFRKVPSDILDGVSRIWKRQTGSNELSAELKNSCREYMCFSTMFHATESFNDWIKLFNDSKPRPPVKPVSTRFTDKVAYEHAQKGYEQEIEEWKRGLALQAKITSDKIYAVLMFPAGGWMRDQESNSLSRSSEDVSRTQEMESLRKLFIPKFAFILQTILQASGEYAECIQLADYIADERLELHSEFTQDQLKDLMKKIRESSLAALDDGLDGFGYQVPS